MPQSTRRAFIAECLENRRLMAIIGLDPSFSNDGIATFGFSGGAISTSDVAIQSDGKIVVSGTQAGAAVVVRLLPDGTIDRGFGNQGMSRITRLKLATSVAITGGTKIVIGGALTGSGSAFGLAQLTSIGAYDNSFGGDGIIDPFTNGIYDSYESCNDVVIQSDGKIIAVGALREGGPFTTIQADFLIARFKPDGSFDNTFDGDGRRSIGFGDAERARAVAIAPGGKIVVAGEKTTLYNDSSRFALIRMNANGSLDAGFGVGGKQNTKFEYPAGALGLAVHSDGRIVAVGLTGPNPSSGNNVAIASYKPDGGLDGTFGQNGMGMYNFGGDDRATDVITLADGSIAISGSSSGKSIIARVHPNGGIFTQATNPGSGFVGIARYSSRRFVVAGGSTVARYLEDGANIVSVGSFDPNAAETRQFIYPDIGFFEQPNPASIIVGRIERLPYPTRVYFSVGGTARYPGGVLAASRDYSMVGMDTPSVVIGTPYVDIPAFQTYAVATLNVNDDAISEGTETAIFKIVPNAAYDIGTPGSATISIVDNDVVSHAATADAYVRDGTYAGQNFGSVADLQVKTGGSGSVRNTYVKFNLASIASINFARLQLTGQLSNGNTTNVAVSVFGASDTPVWSETGITFTNKPGSVGSALATTTILDTTSRVYEWDVSAYLKAQKALGKTSVTLILKTTTSSDPFVTFKSRESGLGPRLLVG